MMHGLETPHQLMISQDYLFDDKANDEAYNYWRERQSQRIKSEEKKKVLFPEQKPHPFGVKRPCLEQNYYEVLDRDNVEIVNINPVNGTPIDKFTEKGIVANGEEKEFDIICKFDSPYSCRKIFSAEPVLQVLQPVSML